jgi:hypothetical protein
MQRARTGNSSGFLLSGGSAIVVAEMVAVWVYSYVPYATPIKALHHAHVYSPVERKVLPPAEN